MLLLAIYLFMVKTLLWYMAPGLERQCSIHISKSVNSNMVLCVSDLHISETLLISTQVLSLEFATISN